MSYRRLLQTLPHNKDTVHLTQDLSLGNVFAEYIKVPSEIHVQRA